MWTLAYFKSLHGYGANSIKVDSLLVLSLQNWFLTMVGVMKSEFIHGICIPFTRNFLSEASTEFHLMVYILGYKCVFVAAAASEPEASEHARQQT